MYPVTRLIATSFRATRAAPLDFSGTGKISFICRPWDLDMFLEMNNGRVLTLYDLGRFDLSIRTGLARVLKDRRWGLAVAGATARYRKRIRAFDKVEMHTQAIGTDARWIFLAQSMWVKGKPVSSLLVRTCVTEKGSSVPTSEVRTAINAGDWNPPLPDWARNCDQADQERPWPPVP